MSRARRLALFGVLALCAPAASAHLVTTGLGPFYDGMGHFVLSLETLLPKLALLWWAGLGPQPGARRTALAATPAWLVAALLALSLTTPGGVGAERLAAVAPWLGAGLTLLVGALAAARRGLPWASVVALLGFAVLGVIEGLALRGLREPVWHGAGMLLTSAVIASLVPGLAHAAARREGPWLIAARALASWLAASGLLMLGWVWRG